MLTRIICFRSQIEISEIEIVGDISKWFYYLLAHLLRKGKLSFYIHTCKKRVMLRRWLFWPKKIAEKVRKSRQNVNRDKSA